MKPFPRLAWLALPVLASFCPGCGCGHNRQVVYPSRLGAPLRAESAEKPRGPSSPIDLQAPTRSSTQAGQVDVPLFDSDSPSPR